MIYNRPVAKGLFVLVSVYFGVRCMVSMVFGVNEEIFKKSKKKKTPTTTGNINVAFIFLLHFIICFCT